MFKQIKKQHAHFNILYTGKPRHLSPEEKTFYHKAILEEAQEYEDAKSLEDEFDALLDILVFTAGAILRHGFKGEAGIKEVVTANMEKIVGPLDKRGGFKLDLQKPVGWKPPNLSQFL
jgi:predicted HAD superfamily Cof-like phosphohydrolase